MKLLNMGEKSNKISAILSSLIYLTFCICYFSPIDVQHKIALPVGLLAIASLILCPWQITMALIFSASGDFFGSTDQLLPQMGCFAVSHIWFIVYFALRYHRKVEHDRKLTDRAKGYVAMILLCSAAILTAALTLIVPKAPAGIMQAGVIVYACLICTMLVLALLQRSSLFALGAVLFVFSDFILAWALFVGEVPNCTLMVMIPYYAAQWLLFIRSSSFKLKHPIRLMRF
jgi:uncharacterized membrane protein YhhN